MNALFGLEYKRYENQHAEIFDTENSDRAFEEEVMLSGFANAQVKAEGSGVTFDNAQETFTARYTHETIALSVLLSLKKLSKITCTTDLRLDIQKH